MARPHTVTPKATLGLHLDGLPTKRCSSWNSADRLPLFLASSGVSGNVTLKYAESALPSRVGDVVKINLQGAVRVRVPSQGSAGRNKVLQLSRLQFPFLDLVEVIPLDVAAISCNQASIDFRFVLPKIVSYISEWQDLSASRDSTLWSSLPSSLLTESFLPSVNGEVQGIYARIIYSVRAQVYRADKILGQTNTTINVYNDNKSQPPTCLDDFPTDYNCQQFGHFTKKLSSTGTSITATVTEPAPFIFYNADDSALTMLNIDFRLHVPQRRTANNNHTLFAETIHATSTWQLKSSTFVSTQPLTAMPTELQSCEESSTNTTVTLGQECQLKWQLKSWRHSSQNQITTPAANSISYTHTARIPLSLTKQVLPTPSLFTPFISRRYSILLRIDLVGKVSGRTTIHLEVPVQIIYQQQIGGIGKAGRPPAYDIRDELFVEHNEDASSLPKYSP